MLTRRSFVVGCAALACAAHAGGGGAVAPSDQPTARLEWAQRPIWAPSDRYAGWPSCTALKDGTILAVFSGDRDGHIDPWGKIQLVRSTDGGETWSAAETIANGPIDDRDAGIVQLPNGDVLVTYFTSVFYRYVIEGKCPWYGLPPERLRAWRRHDEKIADDVRRKALGTFTVRSTDGGRTWGPSQKLDVIGETPHGPVLCDDGSLFVLFYRNSNLIPAQRTDVHGWRSRDGGRTWTCTGGPVPDRNGENRVAEGFNEPAVVSCADGSLLGLIRYEHGDHCLRQTRSTDGGKTWSPAERTPIRGFPAHILRLKDGRLLCSFGRREPGDFGIYACLSADNGRTWDAAHEICLSRGPDRDLGYPSTCVAPDGAFVTVYYQRPAQNQPCALMATKWRLK